MRTSEAAAPRPVWTRNILKQARRLCGEERIGCELSDEGSLFSALPLLQPDDAPFSPLYEDLYRGKAIASASVTVRSLSRFFEYSLAILAWKQAGELRWALRTNPSSGNLHPTEGYLLIDKISSLSPLPGLYHYAAREHALELRAELPQESFDSLMQEFPPKAFLVGFTSVNWRETWKYGERAFRYCQHDVGHAVGSARIAAQTLGWRMLDGKTSISVGSFFTMLARVMPRVERDLCKRPMPWDVLP
jgi:SagB-type dehydrogenase family enzyme